MKKNATITIRVNNEFKEELKKIAQDNDLTLSNYILIELKKLSNGKTIK